MVPTGSRREGSPRYPLRWNIDVGTIEIRDRRAPEQLESAHEVGAQDLDRPRDTGAAGRAQPVRVRATCENGARPKAERLGDVGASTDAAVEQDFHATVDGSDDFGKHAQRRRNTIELSAAVI